MPDVKDSEKKEIKYRAKRLALDLLESSISTGFVVYSQTVEKIYDRSARWKICLHCGEIDKKENLTDDNHECAAGIDKLPVIVTTNWVILKDFFLSPDYTSTLQQLGVEPITPKEVIVTPKEEAEVSTEEIAEELADAKESSG